MPPPHANFAAAVVISESFVNECLNTYLATYADDFHATAGWKSPMTVNGASLTFRAAADIEILSARATLRGPITAARYEPVSDASETRSGIRRSPRSTPFGRGTRSIIDFAGRRLSPAGPQPRRVTLALRFYATATVQVLQGSTVIASYTPTALIEGYDNDPRLIARVIGTQFQFGLDLQNSHLDGVTARILDLGLPPPYQAQLKAGLESPTGVAALDSLLHALAQRFLGATSKTLPAQYDYSMPWPIPWRWEAEWVPVEQESDLNKLLMDAARGRGTTAPKEVLTGHLVPLPEPWFHVRSAASRLVWTILDGCLVAAVDVPGYTQGSPDGLRDFRADSGDLGDCELAGSVNLGFIEDFLAREVLPVMRDAFIARGVRLNKIDRFAFQRVPTRSGDRDGFEIELDVTYWTDEFLDFVVRGRTDIDLKVTVQGYPYLGQGKLGIEVTSVRAHDFPWWLYGELLTLSMVLPPASFIVPCIFEDVLHNATADVISRANGKAAENALLVERELPLPETTGPSYNFDPRRLIFSTAGEKHATMFVRAARAAAPHLEASFEGRTVEVPTDYWHYAIRKEWTLPAAIWVGLVVPHGIFQDHDPTLRVRWQTFLNGRPVQEYTREVPYADPRSHGVAIQTFHFVNPNKTDQEIEVDCRFYRTLGADTEDLLNASVRFISDDPRPASVKPYVQWAHNVKYWDGYRAQTVRRASRIHKVPGKGGCRFSNQYLLPQNKAAWKHYEVRFLSELPFDERFLRWNRDMVCQYCFFGGPDKQAPLSGAQTDFTGVVGKLFSYAHEFEPP